MSSSFLPSSEDSPIYDLIGLGFGPSNLALMAAIDESASTFPHRRLRCLCFERKPSFAWHPNMLIDGATIQLSFLKDLVTLRNPQSRYSFLCYLQQKGRLDRFINLRAFYPTRLEFNDYYTWVAEKLDAYARFGREVIDVEPIENGGQVEVLKVRVRALENHEIETYLTRNLVVATGGTPNAPAKVNLIEGHRVFHSNDFLGQLEEHFSDRDHPWRFAVVGSGQSAAEIFQYLYSHFPKADVTALIRRFAYKPADSSNFVNEIFFPEMETLFFGLSEEKRRMVFEAHKDTNYSCVDIDLIEAIYHDLYQAEVAGEDRFRIRPFRELLSLYENGDSVTLQLHDILNETLEPLKVDGVVLATGFERPSVPAQIKSLEAHFELDPQGRPQVDRHCRIACHASFEPRIFLQGFCESTHGLSDTLLSNLPIRAAGILESLLTSKAAPMVAPAERIRAGA